jgi:hypothetical protein
VQRGLDAEAQRGGESAEKSSPCPSRSIHGLVFNLFWGYLVDVRWDFKDANQVGRIREGCVEKMGVAIIDERRYGRLLAKAVPAVIQTEAENERMLGKIEALMDKGEKRSPEEDRLLELMAKLVEDFEARAYSRIDAG